MRGGTVTIQLAALETSEPRLLPDNRAQNTSDLSFEEKLKSEQARLGLMFSPFAQLNFLFASPLDLAFTPPAPEGENQPGNNFQFSSFGSRQPAEEPARTTTQLTARIFESAGLQPLNRRLFQDLLSRANLLVPNLAAQPLFNQAFLEGKLQTKLDMQFLIDQILDQVKLVKSKGKTELSLTLKPENLGEIYLQLTSLAGKISLLISASPETKKLMDSQKDELARALKRAHVDLEQITIEEAKHA
jgi:hypothetical protein